MKAITIAWTTPWTPDSLTTVYYVNTVYRSFLTPLLVIRQKMVQVLAIRRRVHLPSRRQWAPQPPCRYGMLVESDVQRGIHGILP